jgi:hypothetical protein
VFFWKKSVVKFGICRVYFINIIGIFIIYRFKSKVSVFDNLKNVYTNIHTYIKQIRRSSGIRYIIRDQKSKKLVFNSSKDKYESIILK